jgi:hypothetical protein
MYDCYVMPVKTGIQNTRCLGHLGHTIHLLDAGSPSVAVTTTAAGVVRHDE